MRMTFGIQRMKRMMIDKVSQIGKFYSITILFNTIKIISQFCHLLLTYSG